LFSNCAWRSGRSSCASNGLGHRMPQQKGSAIIQQQTWLSAFTYAPPTDRRCESCRWRGSCQRKLRALKRLPMMLSCGPPPRLRRASPPRPRQGELGAGCRCHRGRAIVGLAGTQHESCGCPRPALGRVGEKVRPWSTSGNPAAIEARAARAPGESRSSASTVLQLQVQAMILHQEKTSSRPRATSPAPPCRCRARRPSTPTRPCGRLGNVGDRDAPIRARSSASDRATGRIDAPPRRGWSRARVHPAMR